MSVKLDPAYRLVHIAADAEVPIADIISAVHQCIGTKYLCGCNRIESVRKDETGYVFLIRRPEHADKLLMKRKLCVNSEELFVDSATPRCQRLEIRNLPLYMTEEDVEVSLMKYGTVRFVRSGLVVDDIRDGTFTASVIFKKKLPKKISIRRVGESSKFTCKVSRK